MEENIYKRAFEKWGMYAQLDQTIEEMAELTIAINKYKRYFLGDKALTNQEILDNLYEELADVRICLEQMEYIFGKENVDNSYTEKMKKFLSQVNS